jgi:hypothetical protein
MKKAEHMMKSVTMTKLIAYQKEAMALDLVKDKTEEIVERLDMLDIIFTKIDMGKILIDESQ